MRAPLSLCGLGRWCAWAAVIALALCAAAPASGAPNKKHKKSLARGEELYFAGTYEEALFVLEELSNDTTAEPKTRVDALKLIAFSYFLLDSKDQAKDAWLRLLEIDPTFKLDPVEESPELVAFFNPIPPRAVPASGTASAAGGGAAGGGAAGGAAAGGEEGKDKENWQEVPVVAERGCGIVLCLIPGGVGQYANGKIVKGVIFTALEAGFLATNIGLWGANQADIIGNDANGGPIYRDLKTAQDRYIAQVVFFVLAVVTPIVGIVDAFVFWD